MGQGDARVNLNEVFKGEEGWLYPLLMGLGWGSNPEWLLDYPVPLPHKSSLNIGPISCFIKI